MYALWIRGNTVCMLMDVNWMYCGDYCAIHTNIKSLYCPPETNRMLHQLHLNKKEERKKSKKIVLKVS